jgi:hypothetical protein
VDGRNGDIDDWLDGNDPKDYQDETEDFLGRRASGSDELKVDIILEMFEMNGFDKRSLLRDLAESESDLRTDLLMMAK